LAPGGSDIIDINFVWTYFIRYVGLWCYI